MQGEFSEGLMHGRGKYTWADGVIYEVSLNIFLWCHILLHGNWSSSPPAVI